MIQFIQSVGSLLSNVFPQYLALLTLGGLTAFTYAGMEWFKIAYASYAEVRGFPTTEATNTLLYIVSFIISFIGVLIPMIITRTFDPNSLLGLGALVWASSQAVYNGKKHIQDAITNASNSVTTTPDAGSTRTTI